MKTKLSQHLQLNRGILCGVGDRTDEWLNCSHRFHTKSAILELCKRNRCDLEPPPLRKMYESIERNWNKNPARSPELWRWEPRKNCAPENASPEVTLERAIIGLDHPDWTNQVPTSSGLADSRWDRHRNVDLIRRRSPLAYEFIELKVRDKHPVYAAMEIVCYGLLYLFCREKKDNLKIDTDLLRAASVHLCVLGPADFYNERHTEWLREFERVLDSAIGKFAASHFKPLEMNFRFDQFPSEFRWKWEQGQRPSPKELKHAVDGIHSVGR